jgi:hypothetical protein
MMSSRAGSSRYPNGGFPKVLQKSSNSVLPTSGSQFLSCHEYNGLYTTLGRVVTNETVPTSRTETKSSSCSRLASPNRPFKAFLNGVPKMESIDLIEFTRWAEHFGSAAFRMTSMYSQLEMLAWVTATEDQSKTI